MSECVCDAITVLPDESADVALEDLPGGRHNNDFEDFRSVEVLPTVQEMECKREPCLPATYNGHNSDADEEALRAAIGGMILDRQFRLLREDFVGPMREAFRELLSERSTKGGPRKRRRQRVLPCFRGVAFEGVECKRNRGAAVQVSFRLPAGHQALKLSSKKKLKEFWEMRGGRILPRDSFVGIMLGGYVRVCVGAVK